MNDSAMNPAEKPLQSWKEIAAYLERDVRTAHRWEKDEGLPVRRHRIDKRSSVYAYPSEIDAWRESRPPRRPESETTHSLRPLSRRVLAAAAAAVVIGAFVLLRHNPALDPIAEAGAVGGGVRTVELYHGGTVGAVSPDGKFLSETDWVSSGDIGIRDLETDQYRRLSDKGTWEAGYGEADRSIFSPDGKKIAYNWLTDRGGEIRWELRLIDAFGDQPEARTIYFNPELLYVQPDGWTADDRLLVQFKTGDSIGIGFVSIDSGELELVKSLSDRRGLSGLQLSQDGRWIAYSAWAGIEGSGSHDVYLLAADGSSQKRATQHSADDFVAGFTPDGKTLLFVSNRTGAYGLWGSRLTPEGGVGAPKMLIRDIGSVQPMGVLPDGALVYQRAMGSIDLYSADLDPKTGRVLRRPEVIPTQYQGSNDGPWLSPDGKRLAYLASPPSFQLGSRSSAKRLMIRNLQSGQERDVPTTLSFDAYHGLRWSPEGDRILASARVGHGGLTLVAVDIHSGKSSQLGGPDAPPSRPMGWRADGRTVLYRSDPAIIEQGESVKTIEAIRPGRPQGETLYVSKGVASAGKILESAVSHRYDRIAWREFATEGEVIKVMSVNGGEARVVFKQSDDLVIKDLTWMPDGESLLVAQNPKGKIDQGEFWIVPLSGDPPFRTELTGAYVKNLAVHPDGKTVFFQAGNRDPRIFRTEGYLPEPASE